jgi:hypothetical protein
MSYSYSVSETFTVTHARQMAAKVATDLLRMQRFYNAPSTTDIAQYETEIVELLKAGYLGTVTYGFKRNNEWIAPTLRYTASELSGDGPDDDPGRVRPGADTSNATFYSYLTYSTAWDGLSSSSQEAFKKSLPFQRTGAGEPGVNGYFVEDRTYSSGGRKLTRSSVRSYSG